MSYVCLGASLALVAEQLELVCRWVRISKRADVQTNAFAGESNHEARGLAANLELDWNQCIRKKARKGDLGAGTLDGYGAKFAKTDARDDGL